MKLEIFKKRLSTLKEITGASDRTGWMVDDVSLLLYTLVKFYKPDTVIQIGHLWGKSACTILEALSDGFLNGETTIEEGVLSGDKKFHAFTREHTPEAKPGFLISVDAFPYGDWEKGIDYLKSEYAGMLDYRVQKSDEFFANMTSDELDSLKNQCVLGVVDGDHSYEGCYKDLVGMSELEVDVIIVDDTLWIPHIEKACKDFVNSCEGYSYVNHALYNGIGLLLRNQK